MLDKLSQSVASLNGLSVEEEIVGEPIIEEIEEEEEEEKSIEVPMPKCLIANDEFVQLIVLERLFRG